MTSTMCMSSHSVSDSASGGPRTCKHATMGCGDSRYLSWCTPHRGGAGVRENECENRFLCEFAAYSRSQWRRAHKEHPRSE